MSRLPPVGPDAVPGARPPFADEPGREMVSSFVPRLCHRMPDAGAALLSFLFVAALLSSPAESVPSSGILSEPPGTAGFLSVTSSADAELGIPKYRRLSFPGLRSTGSTTSARIRRSLDFDVYDFEKPRPVQCSLCAAGVNLIRYYVDQEKSTPEIVSRLTELCTGLRYRPAGVCDQLFRSIGPEMVDILTAVSLTSDEVCSFVFNVACGNGDVRGHRWKVRLPNVAKPAVSPRRPPKDDTPKLKVLHISDTHYDPLYEIGTKDVCELPLCCRKESGMPTGEESAAGKWGGWKCDIPERTLDHMLDHIARTHGKLDYIIWTGDVPPHAGWSQTPEESLLLLNSTLRKIRGRFPDTPLYPALGNHEASPPHNFPPPAVGKRETISWLYDALADEWGRFLPPDAVATIRHAGYYVVQARPGLKLISLNTNFCYYNNWWLVVNSTDPAGQLEWFANQLQTAETEGNKVHVIAHVPPGYFDCLKIWSANYYAIIARYEETVTAQFFGHTHADEIEVYYDAEDGRKPVAVGYVAPAASTHVFSNPGYRVYSVDGDHGESDRYVHDFETWVMNLTEANLNDGPRWYKMFGAKESYGLPSLLPEDWNDFYERLKRDRELLQTYDRHYWKDSPKRPPCGDACLRTRLCDIRSCVHYGSPDGLESGRRRRRRGSGPPA